MKILFSLYCLTLIAANIHAQPLNPAPAIPNRTGRFADERVLASGTLKLDEADVRQVLDLYQELVGKTILPAPNIPSVKITIKAQNDLTVKEAIQALESILSMNGVSMIEQGEKFMKAVPEQIVMGSAMPFSTVAASSLANAGVFHARIIKPANALAREVAPALQILAKVQGAITVIESANLLVIRDYEENVKRMMELLELIDVMAMSEMDPVVIPIKYALATDMAQLLGNLTAGNSGSTSGSRSPTRPGLTSGSSPGAGGSTPGLPGGLTPAASAGSPASRPGTFQTKLNAILSKATGDISVLGQTKIIADERTNSLLVFASKQDLMQISNIIAKMDVVLPQVLIEAIIMEVSLDDAKSYGISYLQQPKSYGGLNNMVGGVNNGTPLASFLTGGTNSSTPSIPGLPGGFTYFAKFGNSFDVALQATANDNKVNVLSRPRIQTSHAREANLFVGETRPYITSVNNYYGSGPQSQYSQLQIGITLSVLPLINADGLVVMDIRQRVQSIGGTVKIEQNELPTTIDREANASVSVHNGETIILGGFISSEHSKSASGVPFLKDVPLVGSLFRSSSKAEKRRELMILIRPTVLGTPHGAALLAQNEKAKLPDITAAEREETESVMKRKIKSDRELLRREGFSL